MADNPNLTVERFRLALADFSMLPASGRVLVCVSGGQDSVALLHLLSSLPPGSHEGLVVAHFNHRMRKAADADEAFVAGVAEQLGCDFTRGEGDVYGCARVQGENVEVVGHELRYAFFADAAREHGCEAIALGHTGSDLAESLLKRDVGVKDSSQWMPGFGGVLDILDSLLLSAPVAWFCWFAGIVGGAH